MLLTRVPVPGHVTADREAMRVAAVFHPVVGACIGGVSALTFVFTAGFGVEVAAGLAVLSTILLTGALHEDGLADCADAFFGGWRREDVLRIMKDSRVGTYGALALVLSVGLRWQLITALPEPLVPASLVAAHTLARSAPLVLLGTSRYVAQSTSKSVAVAMGLRLGEMMLGLALGVVLAWWWLPGGGVGCVVALAGLVAWARGFLHRRLGGYTGDCLGAVEQLGEIVVLAVVLAAI